MSFAGTFKYIRNQKTKLPLTTADLSGKTIIITGANTGIGYETAKHVASMKPKILIMACRSEGKGLAAVKHVNESGNTDAAVFWPLDLSSFESVRNFATRFITEGHELHILIENAGITLPDFVQTADGWESMLQVNYLSTALLALLLLPTFTKTASGELNPRLILVGSDGHQMIKDIPEIKAPKFLEKLNEPKHNSKMMVRGNKYGMTKTMLIMFARRLASLIPSDSPLSINIPNPGLCKTTVMQDWKGTVTYVITWGIVCGVLGRTVEEGSRTLLDAALSPSKGKAAHGRYISTCRVVRESPFARSKKGEAMEEKLWNETIELLGSIDNRVLEVVCGLTKEAPPQESISVAEETVEHPVSNTEPEKPISQEGGQSPVASEEPTSVAAPV